MATVHVKLRSSVVEGKPGTLFFVLSHRGNTKQIKTIHKLFPPEWDPVSQHPLIPDNERSMYVQLVKTSLQESLIQLRSLIHSYPPGEPDILQQIVNRFNGKSPSLRLFSFIDKLQKQLEQNGQIKTAMSYHYAMRSFKTFREGRDIELAAIDSVVMSEYEYWLKRKNVTLNSISFYMRILRAIYNKAVVQELIIQRDPFKNVYTGIEKTRKRAVDENIILKLKKLDLKQPNLTFTRDLFLLSFYTRGMSFVDMAYLRKKDIRDGIIYYKRRKTGQRLSVKLEPCMQRIIDKYAPHVPKELDYVLPIISSTDPLTAFKQYRNALSYYNRLLKKLSHLLGLHQSLSSYVSRHSWATIAYKRHIPLSIISEGMGHYSEMTTKIYLASLDQTLLDRANRTVLKGL